MTKCRHLLMLAVGVALGAGAGGGTARAAGALYGINDSTNALLSIDPSTFAVSTIGSTGVGAGDFGDLTYDANHGVMYWVPGRSNDNLYTINLASGAATLVGSHGIDDLFGLAYDSGNNTLYGQSSSGGFYSLDTSTGAPTLIGNNGVDPGGLAYNAATDTLYSDDNTGQDLFTINPATGAASAVSASGANTNDNGLAWDPDLNEFVLDGWSNAVYTCNAAYNACATVSNFGGLLDGIAFVPGATEAPEPSSLALLGSGLAALGWRRRRGVRAG